MRLTYPSYGHTNTAFGRGRYGRPAFFGYIGTRAHGGALRDRSRFAVGRRRLAYGFGRRYGGYGGGFYGGVGYGDAGYDGRGDGPPGTYGSPGVYATPGVYGGHVATQDDELAPDEGYISEPPLALTRAEPPLAPSPYGGGDGGYAAPTDLRYGAGPRIITVDRSSRGCRCESRTRALPVIYRYGVGTAY